MLKLCHSEEGYNGYESTVEASALRLLYEHIYVTHLQNSSRSTTLGRGKVGEIKNVADSQL